MPVTRTARTRAEWHRLGLDAARAHAAVTEAFRVGVRKADPDRYEALLADFRAATAAALPRAGPGFLAGLADGGKREVEEAIAFLEADPWFFRSGYEKQSLLRHLKRLELSGAQRTRLGRVVIAVIDGRDRREFRDYCRLAVAIWSPDLRAQVSLRLSSTDPAVRRRAVWVAEAAAAAGRT